MDLDKFFDTTERFERLVAELNSQWMTYRDIFGRPENFEVLNQSGALAWLEIRDALINSILLGVGRLLDRPQTFGRDNLSIAFVVREAERLLSTGTSDKIARLNAEYEAAAKTWRNRKIGHNDHRTAMGIDSLPEVPTDTIAELIRMVNEACSDMSAELKLCSVDFVPRYRRRSWTPRLLDVLAAGTASIPIEPEALQEENDELT